MFAIKRALFTAAIAGAAFVAGVAHEATPTPANILILVTVVYLAPIGLIVSASPRLRRWRFPAASSILLVSLICSVLGDYLAYRLEWWGLHFSDYAGSDTDPETELGWGIFGAIVTAGALGILAALIAPVVRRLAKALAEHFHLSNASSGDAAPT